MAKAKRNPAKPCLGCGKKTRRAGSRCLDCDTGARKGSTRAGRKEREVVLERDGRRCVYVDANGYRCKSTTNLHVDHRVSLADGGSDTLDNKQTLCATHNLRKGARSMPRPPKPGEKTYPCARCAKAPVRIPGSRCPACLPTAIAAAAGRKPKRGR